MVFNYKKNNIVTTKLLKNKIFIFNNYKIIKIIQEYALALMILYYEIIFFISQYSTNRYDR